MRFALCVLLCLSACGGDEPYAVTFTGVRLHQRGENLVQAWHVDFLAEILLEEFRVDLEEARRAIDGVDSYFYDELPDVELDLKPGQIAGGYAESKKRNIHVLINEREANCLAYSALQHELMHIIEHRVKGRTDSNHTDCGYWCAVDRAEIRGKQELCGIVFD